MNDTHRDHGCLPAADWHSAAPAIRPALLPADSGHPLLTDGPAGLAVAYVVVADGAEVPVDASHLRAWRVEPRDIQYAAMSNLAAWSESAGWLDEVDGHRRLVWSDSGDGMDAARILLASVRRRLTDELGPRGRVLVAMPERDLLIASGAAPGDREFQALFADYVAGRARAADQPIDARVFELVDGELVEAGLSPEV
jgi:uncharacterized protein YtpQ (UPF0354 family)